MPWDRGYYYRVERRDGRVVRSYVGKGPAAELASSLDALRREQRQDEAALRQAERKEADALDRPLEALDDLADLVARAAMLAAGYRKHNRGEWRKRRGHLDETGGEAGELG